ncbi:MAG: DinB family protein [Phycisphaerales bacterium]|nr:DinB family protein [Phycisphaerales bacterium]
MTTGELLAGQMDETRKWTLMVAADFAGDEWTYQPAPGVQHALWLCGHLAASQDTLVFLRCLGGESVLDAAFKQHFAPGSTVKSAADYDWPAPDSVLAAMADVHEKTLSAVRKMNDAFLAEPAFAKDGARHPHYTDKLGAVSHVIRHEAFHAGQLATLRRLLGKNFLR